MKKPSLLIIPCIALSFFLLRHEAQAGYIIHRPLYLGLNSGVVGFWSFDGPTVSGTSVADMSGAGNHGTMVNGRKPVKGRIGQGMAFDGVNDYVSVSTNASVINNSTYTVCAWYTDPCIRS